MNGHTSQRPRVRIPGKPGLWELEVADGRASRLVCLDPGDRSTEGAWMTTGLFDLQINGTHGINYTDPAISVEALAAADERIRATGTGWYCPTILTRDAATLREICRRFRVAWDAGVLRSAVGLHIEGPFISSEDGYRGAHQRVYTRDPDPAELETWIESSGNHVRLVTLAPERRGAVAFIQAAVKRGVVCCLGHSAADERAIHEAVEAGAKLSTHLFNGCAPCVDRHRNPIFAQLAEDRLCASFIADGLHVPLPVLKIALRAKGVASSVLVSDLTHLAGLPDGEHVMEGAVVLKRDGGVFRQDAPMLSGAARNLAEDVEILARQPEPGIEAVFLMATEQPARIVGEEPRVDTRPAQRLALWDWRDGRLTLTQRIGDW